jgi:hypothetical protein
MDHLIQDAKCFYRSWKYWHAAMLHGKALAVVVAYNMYLEVAEGKLDPAWKNEKPMGFHTFRERLSEQMLIYIPEAKQYQGDSKMKGATQMNARQRQRAASSQAAARRTVTPGDDKVTKQQFEQEKGHVDSHLCGDLDPLLHHVHSVRKLRHALKYAA